MRLACPLGSRTLKSRSVWPSFRSNLRFPRSSSFSTIPRASSAAESAALAAAINACEHPRSDWLQALAFASTAEYDALV